ncbi:MAG: tetratricopeptide repeat protein, partial [Planctomycetota bacterium]
RRYASAAALAEDIRRQVMGEPILARPPSAAYQISRLVARHKIPAALLGLLALTVVTFAVITAVQAGRFAQERDNAELARQNEATARAAAETEAGKARRIQCFLQDILDSVAPGTARGRDLELMKGLLADAARRVETELADQPAVAAEVRTTIGRTYAGLGLFDEAEPHLRAALDFHETRDGEDAVETAAALDNLGMMLTRRGDYAVAEPLLRRALDIRTERLGEDHVDMALSYNRLGKLLGHANRYDEAEELLRRAVDIRRRKLSPDDRLTAEAVGDLAWLLGRAEKPDEAE